MVEHIGKPIRVLKVCVFLLYHSSWYRWSECSTILAKHVDSMNPIVNYMLTIIDTIAESPDVHSS